MTLRAIPELKPVAIFRHASIEGPGFFSDFLDELAIPWRLICIDAGDALPQDASDYSGLVFMGGPMSVNDDLPWIPPVLAAIRQAVLLDIPVLGHCLGGQLMAKALGGEVTRNAVREIGWGQATVAESIAARNWFGDIGAFDAFHWHGETFSLPRGAERLLSSTYCANQGFAIGKHLGLQCHVEMTEQMIRDWCEAGKTEINASVGTPSIQSASEMQVQMTEKLPQLHVVARRLYLNWIKGLTD